MAKKRTKKKAVKKPKSPEVVVTWVVGDILDHAEKLGLTVTEEQAAEILEDNEDYLQVTMIESVSEEIDNLIREYLDEPDEEVA